MYLCLYIKSQIKKPKTKQQIQKSSHFTNMTFTLGFPLIDRRILRCKNTKEATRVLASCHFVPPLLLEAKLTISVATHNAVSGRLP